MTILVMSFYILQQHIPFIFLHMVHLPVMLKGPFLKVIHNNIALGYSLKKVTNCVT